MRVAMDARFLNSSVLRGMDRYLIGLAGELSRRGIQITFFHRAREPLHAAHLPIPGVRIQGLKDLSGIFWEQISVPFALAREKFDLYHAPAERGVPYVSPCPVVLTYHSTTVESYRDLIKRGLLPGSIRDYLGENPAGRRGFFERYHWGQQFMAHHVLTPSEFSREELIRLNGLAPDRVSVTPLAVAHQFLLARKSDEQIERALTALGVKRPYLLYVGGYERHKNVGGLLEMFSHLRACQPDISLVAVGSKPPPEDVTIYVTRLNLPPGSVQLLYGLSTELTDLYDAAELFVTMSWRETFCLPALEAMTRGTPVVSSSWGASPEVVGDAGVLVDPRHPELAAHAVVELLNERDFAARRKSARQQASNFTWSRTADLTLGIYQKMLR